MERDLEIFGIIRHVKTFDLNKKQHEVAVNMIKSNKRKIGVYALKEVDREMANVWIADAHSEGREEYAEFLRNALAKDAELYTLKDGWQEIGEVAVF